MRITSTPNGTSPSDSNDSPCAKPHPIVQLSPSFLVVESFKTRTILNHLRETLEPSTQFNPITILIHREPYRTLSHNSAISIELIPYSNPILIANLMKMMNLCWIKPLMQILTQFVPKAFFWSFTLVFSHISILQWHNTLLFKEKIEWANLGIIFHTCIDTNDHLYRYKCFDQR